jgi:hypothetical protein
MTENPQQPGKSLVRKMNEIKEKVGYLQKKGQNTQQKYKFIQESDVIDAVRTLMIERNLMIWPETTNVIVTSSGQTSGGAQKNLTTVEMKFTIEDGDSGETRTVSVGGQGVDPGDKGIYKATTGANKYSLLKLFQIPTGDDPEYDGQDDVKSRGGSQRNQQQQKPPQQQKKQPDNNPFINIERMGISLNYPFDQLMQLINAARAQKGAAPVNHFNQLEPHWIQAIEKILQKRITAKNGGQR